jgi:hypothetical protein
MLQRSVSRFAASGAKARVRKLITSLPQFAETARGTLDGGNLPFIYPLFKVLYRPIGHDGVDQRGVFRSAASVLIQIYAWIEDGTGRRLAHHAQFLQMCIE